jgi:hypothetical protein
LEAFDQVGLIQRPCAGKVPVTQIHADIWDRRFVPLVADRHEKPKLVAAEAVGKVHASRLARCDEQAADFNMFHQCGSRLSQASPPRPGRTCVSEASSDSPLTHR